MHAHKNLTCGSMGLRDDSILTDLPTIPNMKAVTLNYYRNPQACKVYLV